MVYVFGDTFRFAGRSTQNALSGWVGLVSGFTIEVWANFMICPLKITGSHGGYVTFSEPYTNPLPFLQQFGGGGSSGSEDYHASGQTHEAYFQRWHLQSAFSIVLFQAGRKVRVRVV